MLDRGSTSPEKREICGGAGPGEGDPGGGPAQRYRLSERHSYQFYGIYVLVPNAYEISNYYEVILDRVRGWPRSAFHTFDWTELTEEATGLAQETAAFNPGSVPALARFLRGTR